MLFGRVNVELLNRRTAWLNQEALVRPAARGSARSSVPSRYLAIFATAAGHSSSGCGYFFTDLYAASMLTPRRSWPRQSAYSGIFSSFLISFRDFPWAVISPTRFIRRS